MSLFDFFKRGNKDKEAQRTELPARDIDHCSRNTSAQSSPTWDELEAWKRANEESSLQFDRDVAEITKAYESVSAGGDINKAIAEIEGILINSRPYGRLHGQAWHKKLLSLYRQAGRDDDAWAHLNWIVVEDPSYLEFVQHERCLILKREKRYVDAMWHLMHEHLIIAMKPYSEFKKERFLKEAQPIANKLGWAGNEPEYLAYLIESACSVGDVNAIRMEEAYKAFLKERQG